MCCTFDALQRPAEAQAPAPCSMPQGQEAPGSTRAHTAAPAHLRRCLPAWLLVGRAPPCAAAWQGPPRLRLLPSLLLPWWWSPRRRRPPRAAETPRARGRLLCRRRGRLAARRAHHLQAATGRAARSPPGPFMQRGPTPTGAGCVPPGSWPLLPGRWLPATRPGWQPPAAPRTRLLIVIVARHAIVRVPRPLDSCSSRPRALAAGARLLAHAGRRAA